MRARSERDGARLKVGDEVLAVWGLTGPSPVARRGRVYSIIDLEPARPAVYRIMLNKPARGGKLHDVPKANYKGSWKAHVRAFPFDDLITIR